MSAHPFIKWAGGKTQLLPELRKRVPSDFGRYWEPFVGGGAMLFDMLGAGVAAGDPRVGVRAASVTINDSNKWLALTYRALRDDVEKPIRCLRGFQMLYREQGAEFYYAARRHTDDEMSLSERAALLIFLNKTGFNGLFRVNRDGKFNVPHGKRPSPPLICDEENLRAVSAALQGVAIQSEDFETSCGREAEPGDFLYFDPPYWPASASSDFTAYTKEPFGPKEQTRLRDLTLTLKRRGCYVLLSNADVPPVRELYAEGFKIERVEARRNINSDASKRGNVGELLIT